jgi:FAD binding domain
MRCFDRRGGPDWLVVGRPVPALRLSFVIIDAKDAPTELSKALVVHARTLEMYDQFGLAAEARKHGQPLTPW